MVSLLQGNPNCNLHHKMEAISSFGGKDFPFLKPSSRLVKSYSKGRYTCRSLFVKEAFTFRRNGSEKVILTIPRSNNSQESGSTKEDSSENAKAHTDCPFQSSIVPFGYSRKDVILIGVGVTLLGVGLKSGLEYVGVDPLQAGNVVQLVLVLGLTVGWISTYIFRVSNKEMTYATQLREYESQVMQKRLEGLTEAELEALLEQVEEEKGRLSSGGEQVK